MTHNTRDWEKEIDDLTLYSGEARRVKEIFRTTLHQLQKAREDEREQLLRTLLNSLPLRSDWDDDQKVTFQMGVNAMREVLESYLPPPNTYPPNT